MIAHRWISSMIQVRLLRHTGVIHATCTQEPCLTGASALALFSPFSSAAMTFGWPPMSSVRPVRAGNSTTISRRPRSSPSVYYVNNQYFDRRGSIPGACWWARWTSCSGTCRKFCRPISRAGPQAGHGASQRRAEDIPVERVDSPWTLRSTLQDIFRFIQPRLQPVAGQRCAAHLVEIEMTATNGMLYTLDRTRSCSTWTATRTCAPPPRAVRRLGIVIEMDRKGRI